MTSLGAPAGEQVQQYTCDGSSSQSWLVDVSASSLIYNEGDSDCVSDPDGYSDNATQYLAECDEPPIEDYKFVQVSGDIYNTEVVGDTAYCVTSYDIATDAIGLYSCDGSVSQEWNVS